MSLYIGEDIPPAKLQNARQSHGIDIHDSILLLVDLTFFGSAKNSLLFTSSGVSYKNDESDYFVGWYQLSHVDVIERQIVAYGNGGDHVTWTPGELGLDANSPDVESALHFIAELMADLIQAWAELSQCEACDRKFDSTQKRCPHCPTSEIKMGDSCAPQSDSSGVIGMSTEEEFWRVSWELSNSEVLLQRGQETPTYPLWLSETRHSLSRLGALKLIANYVLVKGEAYVATSSVSGGELMVLTTHRLIFAFESKEVCIPLTDLKAYEQRSESLYVAWFDANGKLNEEVFVGTGIHPSIIFRFKNARVEADCDAITQEALSLQRYALCERHPDVEFPDPILSDTLFHIQTSAIHRHWLVGPSIILLTIVVIRGAFALLENDDTHAKRVEISKSTTVQSTRSRPSETGPTSADYQRAVKALDKRLARPGDENQILRQVAREHALDAKNLESAYYCLQMAKMPNKPSDWPGSCSEYGF